MIRIILISTVAATWLLMVAKPVGTVVQAWLLDVVVYGVELGGEEAPSDEAPSGIKLGEDA